MGARGVPGCLARARGRPDGGGLAGGGRGGPRAGSPAGGGSPGDGIPTRRGRGSGSGLAGGGGGGSGAGFAGGGRRSPGSCLVGAGDGRPRNGLTSGGGGWARGGTGRPRPRRLGPWAALAAARARSGSAGRRIRGGARGPLSRRSGGDGRPGGGRPGRGTRPDRAGARRSARASLRDGCPGAALSGSRGTARDLFGTRAGCGGPRAPIGGSRGSGSRRVRHFRGRRGEPRIRGSRCRRRAAPGPRGGRLLRRRPPLRSRSLDGRTSGVGCDRGRGPARRRVSPRPLLAWSRRLRRHHVSLAPRARDRPPDPVRPPLRPPG